jgi:hypothetical protein
VLGFCVFWGNRASGAAYRVLPSVGNLTSWFSDRGARALLLSGTVGSARPQCSVGKEASWHQQNSKAWSLGFT